MMNGTISLKILRRFFCTTMLCLVCSIVMLDSARASSSPVIVYLFWGEGCPHCEDEKEFLRELHQRYPQIEIRMFELWNHPEFRKLAQAMAQAYGVKASSVPMTFIGEWTTTGYRDEATTGIAIEEQVSTCLEHGCRDALDKAGPMAVAGRIRREAQQAAPEKWTQLAAKQAIEDEEADEEAASEDCGNDFACPPPPGGLLSGEEGQGSDEQVSEDQQAASQNSSSAEAALLPRKQPLKFPQAACKEGEERIPVIGCVNVSRVGLPVFTLIVAVLDGFNPCTIWVLSFLLSLVMYAKSRSRILLIGGMFILVCGFIYFLFMAAWLEVFAIGQHIALLRVGIAIVAITMGLINCKDFFFFKQGVSLTISKSGQSTLFKKMRDVLHTAAIPGVILGTIALATSASLIELPCTAGFPMIYTKILTLQHYGRFQYYLYLVLYNVIYVLPLATIVGVFAWKMGGRKLTEHEGRVLKLIGGALMVILGVIMLVNPDLLMFG